MRNPVFLATSVAPMIHCHRTSSAVAAAQTDVISGLYKPTLDIRKVKQEVNCTPSELYNFLLKNASSKNVLQPTSAVSKIQIFEYR